MFFFLSLSLTIFNALQFEKLRERESETFLYKTFFFLCVCVYETQQVLQKLGQLIHILVYFFIFFRIWFFFSYFLKVNFNTIHYTVTNFLIGKVEKLKVGIIKINWIVLIQLYDCIISLVYFKTKNISDNTFINFCLV
jgi:hypothetical protein